MKHQNFIYVATKHLRMEKEMLELSVTNEGKFLIFYTNDRIIEVKSRN